MHIDKPKENSETQVRATLLGFQREHELADSIPISAQTITIDNNQLTFALPIKNLGLNIQEVRHLQLLGEISDLTIELVDRADTQKTGIITTGELKVSFDIAKGDLLENLSALTGFLNEHIARRIPPPTLPPIPPEG